MCRQHEINATIMYTHIIKKHRRTQHNSAVVLADSGEEINKAQSHKI